jgi:hypothetical protein
MDAVIQVEAANVRAIVTESSVIIYSGFINDDMASTWTIVSFNDLLFFESSIKTNAPNSSLMLV